MEDRAVREAVALQEADLDQVLIEARIREAARFVPLERLALSPQCGFASGDYAITMTHAEQEAKLRLVGYIGRKVWPTG